MTTVTDTAIAVDSPPFTPWVVAVGASAGGLEALQRFFGAIEPPTGAAFVVIQHLAPDHRSMMAELLGRQCRLPVREARPGERLVADEVHLMPPGVLMTLDGNALTFEPRPAHGVSLPIDGFLRSLARGPADHAVAVVLSGSGSDGAAGAAELRAAGGFVLVQTPESARFDGMPGSTLRSTTPDAVGTPEVLAGQVLRLSRGQSGRGRDGQWLDAQLGRPALQRIFDALRAQSGIDFGQYKLPTVMRRIDRRLSVCGATGLAEYADRVSRESIECEALRQELLIPVTGFFRDPDAWVALGAALRQMVRQHEGPQPLRLWSAGCATGEEAFSLAICALEACQAEQRWPGLKVFATDVDARVLAIAQAAVYAASSADALGPARTARHFQIGDGRISVRPELRQLVLFARHNLMEDAPFTRMDLVSCRNTLIYLQSEPQERVLRRLQYALKPGGLLFLGSSESATVLQEDFSAVDGGFKLYRLLRPLTRAPLLVEPAGRTLPPMQPEVPAARGVNPLTVSEHAARSLLQAYAPATLLVSANRHLLHAWGPVERWLRLPPGQASLDVMRLLPPRLAGVAGAALRHVLHEGQPQRCPPMRVQQGDQWLQVSVVARPVSSSGATPCALLSFEVLGEPVEASALPPPSEAELDRMAQLERELAESRLTLQSKIEELESANQELQATNEELMSANEELQSTNEELQSVNEELHTVNAEYNAKLDQVSALHADLEGMSQATGIATVFVDPSMALVRFTPEATLLFRLRSSDVGRSIHDFRCQLDYPELHDDLRAALDGRPLLEREVAGPAGARYLARVIGYGAAAGASRRAVLSLIEVTRLHDADRLQGLIDSLPEHIALLDLSGTIVQVNRAWADFARRNSPAGMLTSTGVGASYLAAVARSTSPDAQEVLQGLQQVLSGEREEYRVTYPCHSPTEENWFVMYVAPWRARPREAGWPAIASEAGQNAARPPLLGVVVAHLNVTPGQTAQAQENDDA